MPGGKGYPGNVASSKSAVILSAAGKAGRTVLGRSAGGWVVPWEARTKAGFETPVVCLKCAVCVMLDIWSLLKILLQSAERVTQSMSYSRTHWLNVFLLISENVGRDLFNSNKLIPQRRRNPLSALTMVGSSCSSQRHDEEGEDPPRTWGHAHVPLRTELALCRCRGTCSWHPLCWQKNTKKTNKPNQPPKHMCLSWHIMNLIECAQGTANIYLKLRRLAGEVMTLKLPVLGARIHQPDTGTSRLSLLLEWDMHIALQLWPFGKRLSVK